MSSNNTTQFYFTANDNVTAVLNDISRRIQGLQNSANNATRSISNTTQQLNSMASSTRSRIQNISSGIASFSGNTISAFKNISKEILNTIVNIEKMNAKMLAIGGGSALLTGKLSYNYFNSGAEFNDRNLASKNAMAALKTSMVEVKKENGELLNYQERYNYFLKDAADLMKKIQIEAAKTSGSSADFAETVSVLMGPALSKGLNNDQIVTLASSIRNATTAFGLNSAQTVQEARAIMTGNITNNATIGKALGLDEDDVFKELSKKGGTEFFDYLNEKLAAFKEAANAGAETLTGLKATFSEYMDLVQGEASTGFADGMSQAFRTLNNEMMTSSGNFTENIQSLIDLTGSFGNFLGEQIGNFYTSTLEKIMEISNFITTDTTIIDPMIDIMSSIKEFFVDFFIQRLKDIGTIISDIIFSFDGLNEKVIFGADNLSIFEKISITIKTIVEGIRATWDTLVYSIRSSIIEITHFFTTMSEMGTKALNKISMGAIEYNPQDYLKDYEDITIKRNNLRKEYGGSKSIGDVIQKEFSQATKEISKQITKYKENKEVKDTKNNNKQEAPNRIAEFIQNYKAKQEELKSKNNKTIETFKNTIEITKTPSESEKDKKENKKKGNKSSGGVNRQLKDFTELESAKIRLEEQSNDLMLKMGIISREKYFNKRIELLNLERSNVSKAFLEEIKNEEDLQKVKSLSAEADIKDLEVLQKIQEVIFEKNQELLKYEAKRISLNSEYHQNNTGLNDISLIDKKYENNIALNSKDFEEGDRDEFIKNEQIKAQLEKIKTIEEDLNALARERTEIRDYLLRQNQEGLISNEELYSKLKEKTEQITADEKERLEVLKAIRAENEKLGSRNIDGKLNSLENNLPREDMSKAMKDMEDIMQGLKSSSIENFKAIIDGSKSASRAVKDLGKSFLDNLFNKSMDEMFGTLTKQLGDFLSKSLNLQSGGSENGLFTTIGQSIGSWFSGGTRASGGMVKAGQLYMTGETGRELFIPSQNGRIYNASETRNIYNNSSNKNITNNITIKQNRRDRSFNDGRISSFKELNNILAQVKRF